MNLLSLFGAVGLSAVCGLQPSRVVQPRKLTYVYATDNSYTIHTDYSAIYDWIDDGYAGYTCGTICTLLSFEDNTAVSFSSMYASYKDFNSCLNESLINNGLSTEDIGWLDYFYHYSGNSLTWYRVYLSSYINGGRYQIEGLTFMGNYDWYAAPVYFDDEDNRFMAVFVDHSVSYTYANLSTQFYSLDPYSSYISHDYQALAVLPLSSVYYFNDNILTSDLYGWLDLNYDDVAITFTTYYTSTDPNFGYNNGYNDGYTDGYNVGYVDGQEVGNNQGYTSGYTAGYNTGKTDGIASANDYSFLALFGAVADTPVMMIRSMFDFEFFGINLLSVVLSLFTGVILFYLLRKLL